MKSFFIIAALLVSATLKAQTDFFKTYCGTWEGNLKIYNSQGRVSKEIVMQLIIDTTENDSFFNWEIVYKTTQEDRRPYLLMVKDATMGDYMVDEKNGILLTAKLFENVLISRFSVTQNLLTIKYSFKDTCIVFEVISGNENNKSETGGGDIPIVYNYTPLNYQKAVLYKKE